MHNDPLVGSASYPIRSQYDDGGFRIRREGRFEKDGLEKSVNILYPSKFYGLEPIPEDGTSESVNNVYLNGVRIAALAQNGTTVSSNGQRRHAGCAHATGGRVSLAARAWMSVQPDQPV